MSCSVSPASIIAARSRALRCGVRHVASRLARRDFRLSAMMARWAAVALVLSVACTPSLGFTLGWCPARRGPALRVLDSIWHNPGGYGERGANRPGIVDDKKGPFTTSHGVADKSTGPDPPFQQEFDWHIASTFTEEEKAAYAAEELEWEEECEQRRMDDSEKVVDVEASEGMDSEYMRLEEGEYPAELPTATVPMPADWQAFQKLQQRVERLRVGEGGVELSALQVEEAGAISEGLKTFYPKFKEILQEGFTLDYDPSIERAGVFIREADPADKSAADLQFGQ